MSPLDWGQLVQLRAKAVSPIGKTLISWSVVKVRVKFRQVVVMVMVRVRVSLQEIHLSLCKYHKSDLSNPVCVGERERQTEVFQSADWSQLRVSVQQAVSPEAGIKHTIL